MKTLTTTQTPITVPGIDILPDIHGCFDEAVTLLEQLGYTGAFLEGDLTPESLTDFYHLNPDGSTSGRKVCIIGDFTDGGPKNLATLRFVKRLVELGHFATLGNHCHKLRRALKGNKVRAGLGLQATLKELEGISEAERVALIEFLDSLPYWLTFSVPGYHPLTAVHAGLPYEFVTNPPEGDMLKAAQQHAIYGETTGEVDEHGFPVRGYEWTAGWKDVPHFLVHGHDYVPHPTMRNNTVAIDTGPIEGGSLTAFRWPEMSFHSVRAFEVYRQPRK